MNIHITLLVMIASCLFSGNAFSADWKYYGSFTTPPDIKDVLFYDSSDINTTNNSIKLWVKDVVYSEIERSLDNKLITEKATKKIANGYIAPITKIDPLVTNAAYLEEAANEATIKSKAEILYQIVCTESKYRRISGFVFNKNGVVEARLGITKWENIAAESNADNLAKIVCGSK